MTLTVRLDPHLEQQLASYCRARRQTKSAVLTHLLREHLAAADAGRKSAYQLAEEFGLVGAIRSGRRDLSANYKRYLKDRLRAKHSS